MRLAKLFFNMTAKNALITSVRSGFGDALAILLLFKTFPELFECESGSFVGAKVL